MGASVVDGAVNADGLSSAVCAQSCPIKGLTERRAVGSTETFAALHGVRVRSERERDVLVPDLPRDVDRVVTARSSQTRERSPEPVRRDLPDRLDLEPLELRVRSIDCRGQDTPRTWPPRRVCAQAPPAFVWRSRWWCQPASFRWRSWRSMKPVCVRTRREPVS